MGKQLYKKWKSWRLPTKLGILFTIIGIIIGCFVSLFFYLIGPSKKIQELTLKTQELTLKNQELTIKGIEEIKDILYKSTGKEGNDWIEFQLPA
jgi:uncharacterized membrane protein YciS (DUF1049 family)